MVKISYEKLSQLQKLILVALSEARYAVMKRRAFNRTIKRLYYGKDSRVATSSLSRAYQRLEDRQYIRAPADAGSLATVIHSITG